MEAYIRDLRKRTPEYKKRFAFTVAAICTLFIFLIWAFVSFGGREVVSEKEKGSVQLAAVLEADRDLLQKVFSGIGETWGSLVNFISNGQ